MSFIQTETQRFQQRNQDKITLSIRLSIQEDLILQELADAWDTTRQEIITRLIQKYVVEEWQEERKKDKSTSDAETDSKAINEETISYFLLNTNSANDIDDHNFMLQEQVAAAFEDGYKEKIKRIKEGDYVFLYASGQGIVAYGVASGNIEKKHHYGIEDKTFFQKLNHFVDLRERPITAQKFQEILNRKYPFAQTLTKISDGEKIINFISNGAPNRALDISNILLRKRTSSKHS